MTRITLFGGSGFIGRATAAELARRGHQVHIPARGQIMPPAGGFGTLIWCIGLTADFRTRPYDTATAHIGLLAQVLAQGAHDRVIYLSSTRIYGGAPSTTEGTTESAALRLQPENPSDLYNATKIAGESLVLSAPVPGVAVRLSNVLGPGEAARETFVGAITRQAHQGQIVLESALSTAKDYLWIEDAARGLADIALTGQQRIYNLASGRQISHQAWVNALAQQTGCGVAIRDKAPDLGFPPIDTHRFQAEFGSLPTDPLDRIAEIARRPAQTT